MTGSLDPLSPFDERALLELIEDELDPQEAERLRQRLAEDPRAAALIERLRQDRAALRDMPHPEPPAALLSELEPLLSRPMLMPDASAWRRRPRRRPLFAALAAAVALVTLAGVWAAVISVLGPAASPDGTGLASSGETGPTARVAAPPEAPVETWPRPGSEIHHHGPLAEIAAVTGEATDAAPALGGPSEVTAEFVLVLRTHDETSAEQTLRRALEGLGSEGALVRNFSYEEADRHQEELRLALGERADREAPDEIAAGPPAPEPLDGRRPRKRARRPGSLGQRTEVQFTRGDLLWGSKGLAPSYERQLDISQRGAVYTVSVPAARLSELLVRLELVEGQSATLRLAGSVAGDAPSDEMLWLQDLPHLREAAGAIQDASPHAVIHLPVVISIAPEGRTERSN